MIGRELWAELLADLVRYQVRAVLMGDPLQLPPVHEEISPAFAAGPGCELTEVMRSQGVLTDAVLSVRERIEDERAPWIWDSARDGYGQIVAHRSHESMRATWLDMLTAGDDVVVVGWTNRAVHRANADARAHIVGDSAAPFVAGEWLVVLKPFCLIHDEDTEHERREYVHVETRVRITKATRSRHKSGQDAWRLELVSKEQGTWTADAPQTHGAALEALGPLPVGTPALRHDGAQSPRQHMGSCLRFARPARQHARQRAQQAHLRCGQPRGSQPAHGGVVMRLWGITVMGGAR